jgi:energy-converting hydrogenase B subunit D
MSVLQIASLVLVAAGAVTLVVTRDGVRLAILSTFYAFALVVLFTVFQAPDVALSELVVGAIAFPLVIVVALLKERGQ